MIKGVIVPLITPFKEGKVDFKSYKNLVEYYIEQGAHGLLPLGTTGESPTMCDSEYEELVKKTMEFVAGRVPVIVGLGGNDTNSVISKLPIAEKYKVDGILSVCPYYNKPSQRGIYEHFKKIAGSTTLDIIIYNIPYRTGVNIENETLYQLAEIDNIVGIKDCCGSMKQTMEFLLNPPKNFSILTGEDNLFFSTLGLGGHGGIMASAHLKTKEFVSVYNDIKNNDTNKALETWKELSKIIPVLFEEPNPAPLKYALMKMGLIESDEIRLPLVNISEGLEKKIDKMI